MCAEDELVGIGLALFIACGVMVFALSGTIHAGAGAVDLQKIAAALGDGLRTLLGISGL